MMKSVRAWFNSGFLVQKLVVRFSTFVITSSIVLMISVAAQSVYSLSEQMKKLLESESELLLQSLEFRLKTVVNSVVKFSEHRLVVNSLVDPEAAVHYLSDIVLEFDKSNEVVSTAVVSLSGTPIFQSDSEFSAWFRADLIKDEMHSRLYDFVFLPPHSLIIFSSINLYGTVQGFVVSKLNLSDQLRFVSRRDNRYFSSFEVFGYPLISSGGLELYPNDARNYFEQVFLAEKFPILYQMNTRLKLRVDRLSYLSPILNLLIQFLIFLLLFAIAAVVLARRFGQQLAGPILRLVEKVSLSSTSPEPCSPLGTFDELELLASAFDKSKSEMKKSQEELLAAKETAEAAVKSRSEFFAVMSHELRTPMNGVLGMTDVLQLTSLSREQADCVETIRGCGEILLNIINDVLDYSKIESGKLQLELLPTDVFKLSERVLTLVRRSAESKGLVLRFESDVNVNHKWLVDSVRLRQILLNFLSNAIKFTDMGEVVLKVKVISQAHGADLFELSVCDTGIGIADNDLKRLFQSFTQADLKITRLYGGTGLGLVICHKLVGLMGGEIHVESEPGRGSCFTARIAFSRFLTNYTILDRLPPSADGALKQTGFSDSFAQHFPLEILIADDDPVNRKVVSKQLEKLGYSAHSVGDGLSAVEFVKRNRVDIIFMDLQMPRMNGYEATAEIRKIFGKDRPFVVGMTAATLLSNESKCINEGMSDFIIKPIELTRLASVLQSCFDVLYPSGKLGR